MRSIVVGLVVVLAASVAPGYARADSDNGRKPHKGVVRALAHGMIDECTGRFPDLSGLATEVKRRIEAELARMPELTSEGEEAEKRAEQMQIATLIAGQLSRKAAVHTLDKLSEEGSRLACAEALKGLRKGLSEPKAESPEIIPSERR